MKYKGIPVNSACEIAYEAIGTQESALATLKNNLPKDFDAVILALASLQGKVVVSGVGKSGHIGRKLSSTLCSTGTQSIFIHATEASHGDLGVVTKADIVMLISNSGETYEIFDLIKYAKRMNIPIIGISSNVKSSLISASTYRLILPKHEETCHLGKAPTTSTLLTLALGDALAVALMTVKEFSADSFGAFHPGGRLGAQLTKVKQLMRLTNEMSIVDINTSMVDTVLKMTGSGFGIAAVTESEGLVGVITDGDLRRNIHEIKTLKLSDVINRTPVTIDEDTLLEDALNVMEKNKVYVLLVVNNRAPTGILRMHDLLKANIL